MKHENSNVAGQMNARIVMCMIRKIAEAHDLNRILEQENKEEKHNENALCDAETVRRVRACNQMGRQCVQHCRLHRGNGRQGRTSAESRSHLTRVFREVMCC